MSARTCNADEREDVDALLHRYFHLGFEYKEVISMLAANHGTFLLHMHCVSYAGLVIDFHHRRHLLMSQRTLQRRLQLLDLRRYNVHDTN